LAPRPISPIPQRTARQAQLDQTWSNDCGKSGD
jgi:hypothetical protein